MNRIIAIAFLLFLSIVVNAQNVTNHLGTEKVIEFDNQYYELAWSAHPNAAYYKQEYLIKGQTLERFHSMITIDYMEGDYTVKDFVNQKIQELENTKKENPIINYNVLEKDGETIIDFLMSVSTEDGKQLLIVERNIYRYTIIENEKVKGILLFSVSTRAYENEITDFFKALQKDKNDLIMKVGNVVIPAVHPR